MIKAPGNYDHVVWRRGLVIALSNDGVTKLQSYRNSRLQITEPLKNQDKVDSLTVWLHQEANSSRFSNEHGSHRAE